MIFYAGSLQTYRNTPTFYILLKKRDILISTSRQIYFCLSIFSHSRSC